MKSRFLVFVIFFLYLLPAEAQSPDLVFPKNGFITSDTSITFEWNSLPGAGSYDLQISTDSLFSSSLLNQTGISGTSISANLSQGQIIFWHVRAVIGAGNSPWSVASKLIIFKPSMFAGLALWLEPSGLQVHASSGKVNFWTDFSGLGRHAKQTDTAFMPSQHSGAINGISALEMDGIDDYLQIDSPIVYKHIFSVSNWTGPTSLFPNLNGLMSRKSGTLPNYILVGRTGYSEWVTFGSQSVFETNMRTNGLPGYSYAPLQNWKSVTGSASNSVSIDQSLIGSYRQLASRYWQGHLAEVLVYSTALTNEERNIVETYLRFKYASPPVNLGRDKVIDYSFCGMTLDAGAGYKNLIWSTGDSTRFINVNTSGTYWVQATDSFGYISRDTIMVNISLPVLDIADTTLCLGSLSAISLPFPPSTYTFSWSNSSTDSILEVTSPGIYWVRVSDSLNCFITDTFEIAVDSFPNQPSLGPDVSLCSGNQIGLVQGSNAVISYLWSGGSTLPYLLIDSTGFYSLTVSNSRGCQAIDTIQVIVKGFAPTMNFLADSACLGVHTNFIDSSYTVPPDSLADWIWDFGDGIFGVGASIQHLFSSPGIHSVQLTITTDSGCFNSIQKDVLVFPSPTASFTPFVACQLAQVQFADLSIAPMGQIGYWQWDFGDPQSGSANFSSQQNPTHTFDTAGIYNVSLVIETTAGCLDTAQSIMVVKPSPMAAFTLSSSCEKSSTYFQNNSTTSLPNPITLRKWDFGDGGLSSLHSPVHVYQDDGYYPVSLWIQALNGCTSEAFDTLEVGEMPTAQFSAVNGCSGTAVQLNNSSSILNGLISSFQWSFQGQIFSTDSLPWYSASDTGAFQIQLLAISDLGCRDSVFNFVYIHPKPQAAFTVYPEYGVPPHNITIDNLSLGATQYLWDFDDGTQSQLFEPVHTYNDSGSYTVTLYTTSDWFCSDTVSAKVFVLTSKVDLSVNQLTYEWKDGTLTCKVWISNMGTRIVRETEVLAWLPSGYPLLEISTDTIEPGQTIVFSFSSGFYVGDETLPVYLCVEARAVNVPDDANPGDNVSCSVLTSDLYISRIYPNPASDYLTVELMLPDDGLLLLEVISPQGKIIKTLVNEELSKGRQLWIVNLSGAPAGLYLLRAQFREQMITRTFIIAD